MGNVRCEKVNNEEWTNYVARLIFDEWVKKDVGEYFIQLFDSTLAGWVGEQPGVCIYAKVCGHASVIEHNGDLYCCDHFVFPEYYLGNIRNRGILDMLNSEKQMTFADMKTKGLPTQCKECKWQFCCHGECPRNRFAKTKDGEPGLNYLCSGYKRFFEHSAPFMEKLKKDFMEKS